MMKDHKCETIKQLVKGGHTVKEAKDLLEGEIKGDDEPIEEGK